MPNKFQIKRTTVSGRTPNTTNSSNTQYIDAGELALNLTDGKLFTSNGTSVIEFGTGTPVYDANGTLITLSYVPLAALAGVTTSIIPSVDNTYNLGNSTFRWEDLYIGGVISANGGTGSAGQVLTSAGAGSNAYWSTVSGGSGTPGGSTTQIQFNDGGAFNGDAGLTFDKATDTVTVGNSTVNTVVSPSNTFLGGDIRVTGNNSIHLGGTRALSVFYIQYNATNNSIDFMLT